MKLLLAWLCVVPLALAQWVYEHKKLVRAMMGLLAIAVLVAVCTGCPVWERPACGSPHAYQCVNDQPHVCATSLGLTPIGDEPCSASGQECRINDAGEAHCFPKVRQ